MNEPTSLAFAENGRLTLFAIAALFLCYVELVFPTLADVIAGLGMTLSTFSAASWEVSYAFRHSWLLTAAFLGAFFVAQFLTSSRGLIALSNLALCLVLLFMMLGVALPTRVNAQANQDRPSARCQTEIERFFLAPNERSLAAVANDDCSTALQASTADLQRLDQLAAGGNRWAARLLARNLRSLDGGELGDAYRALGQFGALHTEEFMRLALAEGLTNRRVSEVIAMLPLELVDDFAAQLAEMRSRRSAIERVSDPQLAETRQASLAAVDSLIEEIERARAALDAEGQ